MLGIRHPQSPSVAVPPFDYLHYNINSTILRCHTFSAAQQQSLPAIELGVRRVAMHCYLPQLINGMVSNRQQATITGAIVCVAYRHVVASQWETQ